MNAARHPERQARAATLGGTTPSTPASPAARRTSRPSWRDPRLLVGLLLVALPVLVGATLLGEAEDTVRVWSAARDLPDGATLRAADLAPVEVRFTSEELAARYVAAGTAPDGLVLRRAVTAGELLPRSALGDGPDEEVAEVPISLPSDAVPADLRPGEVVDVWVTPASAGEGGGRAVRVLEAVTVVAAPREAGALGPSATRQVVVGVPAADDGLLAEALARLAEGTPVLVGRG